MNTQKIANQVLIAWLHHRAIRNNPALGFRVTDYALWGAEVVRLALQEGRGPDLLGWVIFTIAQANTDIPRLDPILGVEVPPAKGTWRRLANDGGGWPGTFAEQLSSILAEQLNLGESTANMLFDIATAVTAYAAPRDENALNWPPRHEDISFRFVFESFLALYRAWNGERAMFVARVINTPEQAAEAARLLFPAARQWRHETIGCQRLTLYELTPNNFSGSMEKELAQALLAWCKSQDLDVARRFTCEPGKVIRYWERNGVYIGLHTDGRWYIARRQEADEG